MKKLFSRFRDEQDGVIALEACISLTLFLFVMLTLYSLLRMFTVQSMISHAAQEACQSIALEGYGNSTMETGTLQNIPNALVTLITGGFNTKFNESPDFSFRNFLDLKNNAEAVVNAAAESTARTRFAAYLGGGETQADELLKNYGVVNGLQGISFTGTSKSGTDMTIQVEYRVRLIFYLEAFHFGEFKSTQKVCCRLWKK